MKLGTLLLRDAVISLSQLEAALRAQVLYGARLGTNLVDLAFLDLDTLSTYLGRLTGFPVASKARFDGAPAQVIAQFDKDLAELYLAFPLGPEPNAPDAMAVAIADPSDEGCLRALAGQCERAIVPYIAPELRIHYYLEKHFDLTRKARFVRPGTRRELGHVDDRRRSQPPRGIELPPAVRFEPTPAAATTPPVIEPRRREPPPASVSQIGAAIDGADARDAIGSAFTDYAVGRFDACVVFLLRDANALGWRVYTADGSRSRDEIEAVSLPLGGASVLQAAHDSRVPYRGGPPTAGRPIERRLWKVLGTHHEPREMLVVPVLVKARVVNLVYVHNEGADPLADLYVEELIDLGSRTSQAYLRLIRAAKAGARATTTSG